MEHEPVSITAVLPLSIPLIVFSIDSVLSVLTQSFPLPAGNTASGREFELLIRPDAA